MDGLEPTLEDVFGYIPPSWGLNPRKSKEDAARAAYEKLNPIESAQVDNSNEKKYDNNKN